MKTIPIYLLLLAVLLSSCSRKIYNNQSFLSSNNFTGKKLAILPVEVYYTGLQPANTDPMTEEQATSLLTQTNVEQAFLMQTNKHKPKKYQQQVEMMNANVVNERIKALMPDVRKAWKAAPDSLGRLVGADLVVKVRMVRTRYMSDKLARGINTGTAIFDAIVNTSTNGISATQRVKAYSVSYEISLIDAKTGILISRYVNKEDDDRNGDSIFKSNQIMAQEAPVYAAQ